MNYRLCENHVAKGYDDEYMSMCRDGGGHWTVCQVWLNEGSDPEYICPVLQEQAEEAEERFTEGYEEHEERTMEERIIRGK